MKLYEENRTFVQEYLAAQAEGQKTNGDYMIVIRRNIVPT